MKEYEYRRYLYMDTDEITAYATVMDGGEISNDVRKITRQSGGNIGAKLGPTLIPFNLSIGLNADRASSREFSIRQNAHVATDKVVNGIKKDKSGSGIKAADVKEGDVIECDVFLSELRKVPNDDQAHPLNWRERRREVKDPRIRYAREYANRQDMLVEALSIESVNANVVAILALTPQWLLRPDEFSRRATVVGKVVGVKNPNETAQDIGDGTINFKRVTVTAELDADPVEPQEVGWFRRKFRKSSKHVQAVASSRAIPGGKPDTGELDISRATIRIAPIAIYK